MANRYSVPIPEPTEEGKVLTVVNGEWQAAEGGGGASGLVVSILWTEESAILDKTYAEIAECLDNGINPVVKSVEGENPVTSVTYSIYGYGQANGKYLVAMRSVEPGYEVPYAVINNSIFASDTEDGVLTLTDMG